MARNLAVLLLALSMAGCAAARPSNGPYRYVVDYASGERRTLTVEAPGEVQGCFLVLTSPEFRVFISGSWVTRIIEWHDGQTKQVDPSRTKRFK